MLGLLALVFCLKNGPDKLEFTPLALLGVSAILLEATAVKLPKFGYLSSSFPCLFCLALLPNSGPRAAAVVTVAALTIRALARGRKKISFTTRETLGDAVPILVAIAGSSILSNYSTPGSGGFPLGVTASLGTLLIYCVLGHFSLGLLVFELTELSPSVWRKLAGALNNQIRISTLSAPMLLLLATHNLWHTLWMTPIFFGIYQFSWDRLQELKMVRERERETRETLSTREEQLEATSKTLSGTRIEKSLVEDCSKSFSQSTSLQQTLDRTHQLVRTICAPQSIALFLHRDGKLIPSLCKGPYQEKIHLPGPPEPLVLECWKSQKALTLSKSKANETRLFVGEKHAAAFPLHGIGVLYVGDPQSEWSKKSLHLLGVISNQATLGVQSAMRQEEVVTALDKFQRANERLSLWNSRFYEMLGGSRTMTTSFEPERVVSELDQLLGKVVPFHWGAVITAEKTRALRQCPNLEAANTVAARAQENREALIVQGASQDGVPQLHPDQQSIVAVPLELEGSVLGAIVLASSHEKNFADDHVQVLNMLALHTAVVLTNCELYSSVIRAQRELEESQAQLVQSSKMAAVGQLAAGVAHEINTPLAAILLGIQSAQRALKKGKLGRISDKLEQCTLGAKSAKETVSKLLFYSRQGNRDNAPVNINELVTDTLTFIGKQLKGDGVNLSHELQESVQLVKGNQNELQQVLINLLVNAKDAVLEEGSRERQVQISTHNEGDWMKIRVTDTGPGVDEERAQRIFEPFFTSKAVGRGTGLGLFLSRQILERHQGTLTLESKPGEGAIFCIALPSMTEKANNQEK